MIDLSKTKCLPEIWHVQSTKDGQWIGYYQFSHPNEAAARNEAERLRQEFEGSPGWQFHVGRYVLADIDGDALQSSGEP